MKNISTLFIESFRNLTDFKMIFPEKQLNKDESLNLNILIGRNGSGKSNILDSLYCIGTNNEPQEVAFNFYMLDKNNKHIIANYNATTKKKENLKCNEPFWNKVIRAHCSYIPRNKENTLGDIQKEYKRLDETAPEESPYSGYTYSYFTDKSLDFDINRSPIALIAYILSGKYSEDIKNNNSKWHDINKIVIEEHPEEDSNRQLEIKAIWIKAYDGNAPFIEENKDKLPPYSYKRFSEEDTTQNIYYWSIEDIDNYYEQYTNAENRYNSPYTLLKENFYTNNLQVGFLYTKEQNGDVYPDSTLSDGQLALLYRFAIVNLLKYEDKKCLLLLDEPETYFNEYWKSYFVYLIWETLKNKPHDVFIATHSAMLITDTKPEEVHRIVDTPNGAYHYKPQVNTYGVSVVDIGRYLFMMESDIGNRARNEIQQILNQNIKSKKKQELKILENDINKLLRQVGPGEWRWKLRVKQKEVENKLLGTN